jgi:hypothetical protein
MTIDLKLLTSSILTRNFKIIIDCQEKMNEKISTTPPLAISFHEALAGLPGRFP